MHQIINQDHILKDAHSTTQKEVFHFIAKAAYKLGLVDSEQACSEGLQTREDHDSTGFLCGMAIPHCKSSHVKQSAIFVVNFEHPIPWETMDENPVSTVISLLIPESGSTEALHMLSKLSRSIMKPDTRTALKEKDTQKILETIHHIIS